MLEQEEDAQLLTVAVSSNETSDKSASDLVLFPFALSLPFQSVIYSRYILYAHLNVLWGEHRSHSHDLTTEENSNSWTEGLKQLED